MILIILTICSATSAANLVTYKEQYIYQNWLTQDGLPQNIVKDIVQTKDGYLWIATTSGIARFDGVKFTTFTTYNTPGLISNRISTLSEDLKGNLWIGTEDKGICKYQAGKFTNHSINNELSNSQIIKILPMPDGDILITTGAGVYHYKDNKFIIYKNTNTFTSLREVTFNPQKKRSVDCCF